MPGARLGGFRLESGDVWLTMAIVFGVTSFYNVIDEGMQRDARNKRIEQCADGKTPKSAQPPH